MQIRPLSASSQLPRVDQSGLRKKSLQQMNLKRTLKPTQVDTPQENMKKNQVQESLNIYEKQLFALQGTSQQQTEVEALFSQLNKYAMKILNQQVSPEMCILILQWIIEHRSFQEIPNQICLAYNNLGCVYRRTGQTQLAFNSFENALNLVQMYDQMQMATITYLNITAVLSQMNMHDKALKAAVKAIESGKQEFKAHQIETIKYLALAHYNKALELEALQRSEEAVKQYKRALEFVGEHLGNNDPLFKKFYVAHQQAKQRYVVSMSAQQPDMLRTVLQQKRQYEVPTDESISMTPQVKTQKNFYIKQNNYVEDTIKIQDSSATIKKGMTDEEVPERKKSKLEEPIKQDEKDTKKSSQSEAKIKKNQIEEIQLLEVNWSNSEPSDTEVKKQRLNEKNPPVKISQVKISNKEQRLNFLNKQNAFKLISDNLLEKEQQIIREIEGQMYNAQNIKMIQAQVRMKQERKKFLKLKQAKKDQGALLPSDELKLKKFQRFIKKKLAQLKIRAVTKKIVQQNRLKKYPKNETKAIQKVIALLEAQKMYKRMMLHKQMLQTKQFHTIRQSFCQPQLIIEGVRQVATESYIFTFAITSDDTFVRFALVNGVKNKRKSTSYYFEMDILTFQTALGLLHQYIDDLECYIIEENQLLKNLKKLQTIASQFLWMNEVDGKYFVRNLTDNQKQFRLALARASLILQDLILIDHNKFLIQGINNFDYNLVVPLPEIKNEFKPSLSVKPLNDNELKKITIIQSFIKGCIQRWKLRKMSNTKRKQVLHSELIRTNAGEYLQIVKSQDIKTQKNYLYIIDQGTQKKSNDLEIKPVVFSNMGDITKENLYDFLVIDLQGPSIEYSEEAQYMIQKQAEYEKRGGKHIISKKSQSEYITLIQRSALAYLFRRRFRIKQANQQKYNLNTDKKNIDREMLVRRVLIYGQDMNSRASLTTLYLETEKTDPEKSLMGQSEYQSVTITSKNLEHVYAFDKVIPYFQKLFYPLQRSEMITIAQKMVEESRIIKNKKGEQKVECRGVDEIYGEILSQLGEEDENNVKKENTLQARMKLGCSWRDKYMQQALVYLEDTPEFQLNHIADYNKQSNFIKIVQIKHRLHGFKIGAKVKFSKHVDVEVEESVRSYVNNVLPTTEYGTDPTLFLEEEQEMQQAEERQTTQTLIDQEIIFDQELIINENHFRCKIKYHLIDEQFITTAENQESKQKYQETLNRSDLCTEYDIPYSYIKDNVYGVLIPLITYTSDDVFLFDVSPPRLQKIQEDYKTFEINEQLQEKFLKQQQLTTEQVAVDLITDKITLAIYNQGNVTLLYEFHRIDSLVRLIIEFKSTKEHRVIEIDTHSFQSKYIDEKLASLTNLKIIVFFKEFTKSLTKSLVINVQEHTHNFEDIRPNISLLLREKFIEKIQGMLLVKRMVEKFRMYKQLKYSKLYMHKFIVNSGQHYIEVLYFLIKKSYNLQIIMREITCVTPQGHLVEKSKTLKSKRRLREKGFLIDLKELKDDSKELMGQMIKKQDQMDLQRIDFNQLAEYQQMKTIEYYRTLLTPLILIIQQNLKFHFNKFQLELPLAVRMRETKLSLRKKKTFVASKLSFGHLMLAAEKMQAAYKKMKHEQWYLTKVQRIKDLEEKNKNMGKFIKRTFKQIDEDGRLQYYIINVYQKQGKGEGQIKYTYELIPVFKYERKNKLRQTYTWDPTQLIDLGSGQLYNYFLNKIYIENSIIKFSLSNFQQAMPQEMEQLGSLNNSMAQEQPPSQEDENGQKILVQTDVKEVLIDQEQQGDSVVNVVFTNAKPSREKRQIDQSAINTTTFQVNLQEIKQLYPHLNVKDPNAMKIISQNLIKGVRMDVQSGSVLLDKGRIQQSFISVVGRSPVSQINFQQQSQLQKKSRLIQRPHQNNALEKTTVTYNGEKYLIVISFIQRKIEKILNQDRDTVFEEFERVLQVKATNLKNKEKDPIVWNVTPDDAEILTHESDIKKMAATLAKRVQVLNDKFMYLCSSEQDLLKVKGRAENTVILFVESIMKPIQNKFRNRQLESNYRLYRQVIKSCKQEEYLFYHRQTSNLSTKSSIFIVLFIEDKNKKVTLMAWDASDKLYYYQLEIPIKKYYSIFLEDKKKCCMSLVHFVELKPETNKLYFQNPKFEQVSDYFDMEKKLSIHSSSRYGSPEKSVKEQSPKFFKQHTPSPSPMITVEDYKMADAIGEDEDKDGSVILKQQ